MPVQKLEISSVDELREEASNIRRIVELEGVVIIRGLVSRKECRRSLDLVKSTASTSAIAPSGLGSRELVRTNSLKWSIGGTQGSQAGLARLMLTCYNPLFADDIYLLHSISRQLIEIRDICADRHEYLHDESLPQPFFNAARVQLYPQGGGFMAGHVDSTAEQTASVLSSGAFLQPLVLLSERGVDFSQGGAFIRVGENYIDVEEGAQAGDVVIYDERSFHGVADIDTHLLPDFLHPQGRAVLLVTIYE